MPDLDLPCASFIPRIAFRLSLSHRSLVLMFYPYVTALSTGNVTRFRACTLFMQETRFAVPFCTAPLLRFEV
jgi:hypothetical protein